MKASCAARCWYPYLGISARGASHGLQASLHLGERMQSKGYERSVEPSAPSLPLPPCGMDDIISMRGDVMLLEPPQWLADSAASACMAPGCGLPFNFMRKRHHCRACGLVFCAGCTSGAHTLCVCGWGGGAGLFVRCQQLGGSTTIPHARTCITLSLEPASTVHPHAYPTCPAPLPRSPRPAPPAVQGARAPARL
jgi:hypothetical protein